MSWAEWLQGQTASWKKLKSYFWGRCREKGLLVPVPLKISQAISSKILSILSREYSSQPFFSVASRGDMPAQGVSHSIAKHI